MLPVARVRAQLVPQRGGAELVFSCIRPALELFSKYERVETAEGREVKLDEFMEKVWEVARHFAQPRR